VTRFEEVLGLGDDALIAAQRLAQWSARGPELEEDIALTNIALDQLGAARALLSYAGELEGAGRDEDALAYLRGDREFRNVLLVELPDGDFAVAIGKLLFLAAYQRDRYERLAASDDERLGGVAAKAVKESAYHLDHAILWTLRLGDGTEESHRRMQSAVDELWPYTYELFDALSGDDATVSTAAAHGRAPAEATDLADGTDLRGGWLATVESVLAEATLTRPADDDGWQPRGGREGRHTEHLSYLLGEMQVLHRAHPGARW
jgi:ring-1,2-phenylacetyl-CoA epoxidase subunit PaaC